MASSTRENWSSLSGIRAGAGQVEVFRIADDQELQDVIRRALQAGRKLFPLGAGSNLIGSDGTNEHVAMIDGRKGLTQIRCSHGRFSVGAGVPLSFLAARAAAAGLKGLCELSGIPGTLGGAVAMNAGALGHSLSEFVERLTVVDLDTGERIVLSGDSLQGWGYRQSPVTNRQCVVEAELRLEPSLSTVEQGRLQEERLRRAQVTPKGCSCGSVFRNPPGQVAGKLLEEAGCKGKCMGPFSVSQQHANWIVNLSGTPGSAADCRQLVQWMQEKVARKFGVDLQPEWRFFDDFVACDQKV